MQTTDARSIFDSQPTPSAEREPPPAPPAESARARLAGIARRLAARPFVPHPLFRSGHAQTLAAYAWPRRRALAATAADDEERLFEVAPGARVLVRCRWQAARRSAPTLLLVHGLEGSAESRYMLGAADKAARAGFNVLRMNLRTCGGTIHLTQTLYHSGLSQDVRAVVEELGARDGLAEIYLAGFSLGGNQALKLAGEQGGRVPENLRGVAAVSPSIDLAACAEAIKWRSNWLYNRQFLRSLKRRLREAAAHYPEIYDPSAADPVGSIREFDAVVTAPHGGFRDADDYYAQSSSLQFIPAIRTPTLIIQGQDDPFVPFESFRHPSLDANPHVLLLAPTQGGHVGFVSGDDAAAAGEDRFWAENRVVEFCLLLRGGGEEGAAGDDA